MAKSRIKFYEEGVVNRRSTRKGTKEEVAEKLLQEFKNLTDDTLSAETVDNTIVISGKHPEGVYDGTDGYTCAVVTGV